MFQYFDAIRQVTAKYNCHMVNKDKTCSNNAKNSLMWNDSGKLYSKLRVVVVVTVFKYK